MGNRSDRLGASYASMDEALAEIRRLRDEIARLRQEFEDPVAFTTATEHEAEPSIAASGDAAPTVPAPEPAPPVEPAPDNANEWTSADPGEHAALERLERLRVAIGNARTERERAVQEFRSLVEQHAPSVSSTAGTTGTPAPAEGAADRGIAPLVPPVALPIEPPRPNPVSTAAADPGAVNRPIGTAQPGDATEAEGGDLAAADRVPGTAGRAADQAQADRSAGAPHATVWTARHVVLIVGTALFVALASFLLALQWTAPREAHAPGTTPDARGGPAGATPAPAPGAPAGGAEGESRDAGTAAAPEDPPLRVELRTVRESWLRVVVDGERRLERLVPVGESILLEADGTVVVRAGDAGGVTVSINGSPHEVMGRDGRVADRTYTAVVPPR
jgi:hypothetical protein